MEFETWVVACLRIERAAVNVWLACLFGTQCQSFTVPNFCAIGQLLVIGEPNTLSSVHIKCAVPLFCVRADGHFIFCVFELIIAAYLQINVKGRRKP